MKIIHKSQLSQLFTNHKRKFVSIVSLLTFVLFSVHAESVLSLAWDSLTPGTQVQGLTEKPVAGCASAESRIYVGNSTSVSSPNCLVYDFADFLKGKCRGYPTVQLPSITNDWSFFSICFRWETGSVSGEIRGYYDLPGQGTLGKKMEWPFFWLSFNEMFSVLVEGGRTPVRVGSVMPDVWHRVQIAIPPPDEVGAVSRVRLERMDVKSGFAVVGMADIPVGKLVLRKATSFDLTGSGPCKFFFDDIKIETKGLELGL